MPRNIYRLKDNTIVLGVTTICNQLGKGDGLMNWAHKIAYDSTIEITHDLWVRYGGSEKLCIPKYEDIQKWQGVRDSAGTKGTSVHDLVAAFLSGEEIVIPEDKTTQNCFKKFKKWWGKETKENRIVVESVESPFVSEKLKYGGQPDVILDMGGHLRLIDIKTGGKWVYPEWWYQLAGYDILLRENGYKVDEYQILWLPKDDRFDCPIKTDLRKEKRIFKNLLKIYQLRRD